MLTQPTINSLRSMKLNGMADAYAQQLEQPDVQPFSFDEPLSLLARTDLLILDDFGLKPLQQQERHDLLELIEDRHGLRSTLITSQLPISAWHDYLSDPTVADALLDRLTSGAHRIELKGESMRKKGATLTKTEAKK